MTTAPKPDVLERLAERCETASGPDRELDAEIGYAVDLGGDDDHLSFRKTFDICGLKDTTRMAESYTNIWRTELPRYTASLDAAMTLVPEEALFSVGHRGDDYPGQYTSTVMPASGRTLNAHSATPALALTAACLRAKAALAQESEPTRCKNTVARGESMEAGATTSDALVASVSTYSPSEATPAPADGAVLVLGWLLDAIKSEVNLTDEMPLLKRRFADAEKLLTKQGGQPTGNASSETEGGR